jgi:hypothetical protein
MISGKAAALLVAADAALHGPFSEQIVGLAARHSVPAIYDVSSFVRAGGLISYSTNRSELYHQQVYISAASSRARSPPPYRCNSRPLSEIEAGAATIDGIATREVCIATWAGAFRCRPSLR